LIVTSDNSWLGSLSDEFQKDIDVIRALVSSRGFPTWLRFSNAILCDERAALFVVSNYAAAFQHTPTKLQGDKKFVKSCVRYDGSFGLLSMVSPEFKDDADVVMAAVSSHNYALRYASDRLKSDKTFMSYSSLG